MAKNPELAADFAEKYQRGFNASYTFKWSKRAREWHVRDDPAAERRRIRIWEDA